MFSHIWAGFNYSHMLGMHRSNEGCNSLLKTTAAVLSERTLQMLFVSAQETNIALCIKYAAQQCVLTKITCCK